MTTRNWISVAFTGAALAAPACALVLGVEDLPQGTGGAGGARTTSTGEASSSATTSSHASSGATSSHSSSSATSSHSSSGVSSSSSSATSSHSSSGVSSSSASTSSSAGGPCAMSSTCEGCVQCMTTTPCKMLDATCTADTGCKGYFGCVVQCPEDGGFDSCAVGAMGCNGQPNTDPNYLNVQTCVCSGCKALCPGLCP